MEYKYTDLTDRIIRCFYDVYNKLGYGFLEKVYEKALCIELTQNNLQFEQQYPVVVYYKGHLIGDFVCDLIIENKIIVEIKAVRSLVPVHDAQLLNYLKGTQQEVGLLLNFGPEPQVRRKAFSN